MKKGSRYVAALLAATAALFLLFARNTPARAELETEQIDGVTYYKIGTVDELEQFRDMVNTSQRYEANALLTADIVYQSGLLNNDGTLKIANPKVWTPIGGGDKGTRYKGIFDGQGHSISGLYMTGGTYVGFFANMGNGGQVRNLHIKDSLATGTGNRIGLLAGYCYKGTITGCTVQGAAEGSEGVGLIAGETKGSGVITGCSAAGWASGSSNVGGITGNLVGQITDCESSASVTATGDYAGGITGSIGESNGTVTGCINRGSVQAYSHAGGIVGSISQGTAKRSINHASVMTTGQYAGGVCGYANGAALEHCANTGAVTANAGYAGSLVGKSIGGSITGCYSAALSVSGGTNKGLLIGALEDGTKLSGLYYLPQGGELALVGTGLTVEAGTFSSPLTAEALASGEAAWTMNGEKTDGSQPWYQNLDNEQEKDSWPTVRGGTVYKVDNYFSNSATGAPAEDTVIVNISWGDMEFTYTEGLWDPRQLAYGPGAWTAADGGGTVTVENKGTAAIRAKVAYAAEGIAGSITDSAGKSEADLDQDGSAAFTLTLTGQPTTTLDKEAVGSITVTVSAQNGGEG